MMAKSGILCKKTELCVQNFSEEWEFSWPVDLLRVVSLPRGRRYRGTVRADR